MLKIINVITICSIIILLSCWGVSYSKELLFKYDTIEKLTLYSELVIEGTIASIHVDSLYEDIFKKTNLITEITIVIDTLWAGYYEPNTIVVSYRGGFIHGVRAEGWSNNRYDLDVSDKVLVFTDYSKGFYKRMRPKDNGIFVIGRDGIGKNGRNIFDSTLIKIILHDIALKRTISGLSEKSDIVVRGKFVNETADFHYIFNVEETYKGNHDIDSIIVAFQNVFGSQKYPQMWRQSLISAYSNYELGKEYILFLNKDQDIYFPFYGRNCVYQISGEDVILTNRRIPKMKYQIINEIKGADK